MKIPRERKVLFPKLPIINLPEHERGGGVGDGITDMPIVARNIAGIRDVYDLSQAQ